MTLLISCTRSASRSLRVTRVHEGKNADSPKSTGPPRRKIPPVEIWKLSRSRDLGLTTRSGFSLEGTGCHVRFAGGSLLLDWTTDPEKTRVYKGKNAISLKTYRAAASENPSG